ncbi:MAG: hypothetical protein M1823_005357 [Watsoniomyces obsoletus]|nr:MAG: hypothetical protein M1823_005357 [Watsoniomyces obsoletus]
MEDTEEWQAPKEEGEDEEDGEMDESASLSGYKTVKDAILFAIEVNRSMLKPPPPSNSKNADHDAPISAALKCAYQLMQQRIISNPKDMMGILLFGTEKTQFQGEEEGRGGGLTYPHCYLLVDLDVPSAADVKALKSVIEDEGEFRSSCTPSKEPVSMANVLFCANQIFTTKAPNFVSRRLFIVTDEDDPHARDRGLRSAATVRAKDLYDLGVTLDLFPISRQDHEFDRSKFYEDIIYSYTPADPNAPAALVAADKPHKSGDGISLLNGLLSSVNSRSFTRSAIFANMTFELGPECKLSVKGFVMLKRQEPARSCFVYLKGEKAEIAKGVTTKLADDAARPVEQSDVKKAYKFGGEQVVFTPEEITALRFFGDPIIRIIGFKPMSMLPIWASLKQSTFIYPSEEEYMGSTRVFSALQQKLLQDGKMGVAWFIARKNAAPVIAAIIPGPEQLGEHGEQTMPPGMWIVPLPYADDIRQNPDTTLVRSPDSLVNRMRVIVQQLQLPKAQYQPERYPNPALQWHYRILQAMALDEDLPDKPDDKTIPKYRQISKRVGQYMAEWEADLDEAYNSWSQEQRSKSSVVKRVGAGSMEVVTKRVKPNSGAASGGSAEQVSDAEMRKLFETQSIAKLTVPALKAWLESHQQSMSGKKSDLIERIEQWFERKH